MVTVSGEDVDITDCAKCRQLITDPTSLPCLDSLCSKCCSEVRDAYRDDSAGVAACPRCGDQFPLPISDRHSLPDCGFIDTLVALRKIASQNLANDNCEICKQLTTDSEPVAAAEFYCIECRLRMCASCCGPHRVFPSTKNHTVVGLGLDSAKTVLDMIQSSDPACSNHKDKDAAVHCYQCRVSLCDECQRVHSGHELEVLTDQTFSELSNNVRLLSDQLHQVHEACKSESGRVEKLLMDRRDAVAEAEKTITDKADELITLIKKHRDELLSALHSRNDQVIGDLKTASRRLSSAFTAGKMVVRFAEELSQKASVKDLLLNYRVLYNRASQLQVMSTSHDGDSSDVTLASVIQDVCTSLDFQSKSFFFVRQQCHRTDDVYVYARIRSPGSLSCV